MHYQYTCNCNSYITIIISKNAILVYLQLFEYTYYSYLIIFTMIKAIMDIYNQFDIFTAIGLVL